MSTTRRLSPEIAKQLGLEVKQVNRDKEKFGNPQYSLNKKRLKQLNKLREGILNSCESVDVDIKNVKHLWKKTDEVSLFIKNPEYKEKVEVEIANLKNDLIDDLKKYSPTFTKLIRKKDNESYLLVIDPADIHIGKLASGFECGEDYNNQIAVQRSLDGVKGILSKCQGFHIEKLDINEFTARIVTYKESISEYNNKESYCNYENCPDCFTHYEMTGIKVWHLYVLGQTTLDRLLQDLCLFG